MRPIDADALWKKFCRRDTDDIFDITDIREVIDDAPTIEPKRGEWIISYTEGIKQTECSACGVSFTTYDVYGWNYCPWCGARMKGADDGTR